MFRKIIAGIVALLTAASVYANNTDDLSAKIKAALDNAALYSERAYTYSQQGADDLAIADCSKAINIEPSNIQYYVQRASLYSRVGSKQAAVADYRKAIDIATSEIEHAPGDKGAYIRRGWVYREAGNKQSALADFDQALKIDPEEALAYLNRANCNYAFGDYAAAIPDYSKTIELHGNGNQNYVRESYWNQAQSYMCLKQYNNAILNYNWIVNDSPDNCAAYRMRGYAYRDSGLLRLALDDDNKAVEIGQGNEKISAYRDLICVYAMMNRYQDAVADCTKVISLKPDEHWVYLERADAYNHLQEYDKAIADYSAALKNGADNEKALSGRAWIYVEKKNYDEAVEDYSRAIKINPQNGWLYRDRGYAYFSAKKFDKALADSDIALKCAPNGTPLYAYTYLLRGDIYWNSGDKKKAAANYIKCRELDSRLYDNLPQVIRQNIEGR